ncbi:glycosyl hydrolase-related protein [Neobacillus pocheonensis]|uniref:glycoside hydrolase family 38 N-terminal domain-containing protein n=1 Tax=Neobacillus pocheonensis TaxID=363869 RepID=UPI003D28F7D4
MDENLLWSIGSPLGRSKQLIDNYKQPSLFYNHVFKVNKETDGQRWPLFHPSEADPDAGYRLYPYTVKFHLNEEPSTSYKLKIDYLVIAPRLAYLEVAINGVKGNGYLRPKPSEKGEITLHSGLHTTIYSEGELEIIIPKQLLVRGENSLVLTSRDGGVFILVDNLEKVKRLDRMANGAGFIYQSITFSKLDEELKTPIRKVDIKPSVLYKKTSSRELVEICHFYLELNQPIQETELTLKLHFINKIETLNICIPKQSFGHFFTYFHLSDGDDIVNYELTGKNFYQTGRLKRRRKWKVYITPHSHTDIGYTHRQWEVAERLCRNIDTALEFLKKEEKATMDIPTFAYHLDASWVLETYLATRSKDRIDELHRFIKAGRLGVPHSYVDLLTQFASLEELIRNGEYSESLLRPKEQRASFNTIVDVPSLSGSLPAIYEGSGVKYLVHANNQDRGPFRLNGGLHKISPFYWEGVNGGKVLVWLSKMYCELRKVCGSPPINSAAERGLEMWLDEYENDDYKPDAVLLYGQEADNTDLDPQPIEFTRTWNETYAYPALIACEVNTFFEYVESNFGDSFETVKGDGGAYWEDGVGSTIVPAVQIRQAQAMLPAAEKLESLAVIHNEGWEFPQQQFEQAWRANLQFVEHTWGAFLSGTDPDALLQQDQWAIKEHFAKDGSQWAKRLLHTAAVRHSLNWKNNGREIVVYNAHSWPVSGEIIVEIAKNEQLIDSETEEVIPIRLISTFNSQAIVSSWIGNVPRLGYRRIELKEADIDNEEIVVKKNVMGEEKSNNTVALENDFYRLVIDLEKGCLTSAFDKVLQKELIDLEDKWGFGQFLYAKGGEGTRLVGNQMDLLQGNAVILSDFSIQKYETHSFDYGKSIKMEGKVPFGTIEIEWKLLDKIKSFDVSFVYQKEERLEKEAVYVAFPLSIRQAETMSDSQLGWVNWDKDQLPGGCKEWLPLQTGILVDGKDIDVYIASPDIPLFCIGDIVKGNWPKELPLSGSRIFSYVLNNYWNTNYSASQGGEISFHYSFTSQSKIKKEDAYRWGWEKRQPLYGHRISFQDFRTPKSPYHQHGQNTLASIDGEKVALITIKKARWKDGWLVRLQEISGENQITKISLPGKNITEAWKMDLLEKDIHPLEVNPDGSINVEVPAWGLFTARILVKKNLEF